MESLEEIGKHLESLDNEVLLVAESLLKAQSGNFYSLDFMFIAAINRARSNISAFSMLMVEENYIAALPFVRMQLDSVLRLMAAKFVSDPQDFASKVMSGTKIGEIKDRDGKKLRDPYLVEKLEISEPWVRKVYESCSGFIHLSNKHIFSVFTENEGNCFKIAIGKNQPHIEEKYKKEAYFAICHCTQLLIALCKERVAIKNRT